MSDNIKISKKEYRRLLKQDLKMCMLEAAGVDNWSHYGDALNPGKYSFYDDDFLTACDKIDKEVDKM